MNMRKSITPNGEMLIDAVALLGCKLEIQRQIMPPDKGDGRLEPYDGKLSSTVLRRVGAGNRSVLFGIDGSTTDRQMLIDKFNNNQVDAALCSIQACGQGITLTAANHVIHIDRWWNPAVEDQATDRVHRIGQDKTVYVYRITTTGTLEEKIALLLEKKRNISDKIIGGAIRQKMQWTREELLEC